MNPAEPIPVIPLEYARTDAPPRRGVRTGVRVCLGLAAVTCLAGWGLISVDTETVLFSGAVLVVAGVALFLFSMRMRFRLGAAIGLAHCGLVALFIGLVNGLSWGPSDAHKPFLIMGGAYNMIVSVPVTIWAYVRLHANDHELPSTGPVTEG